jgi:hypothetical protein
MLCDAMISIVEWIKRLQQPDSTELTLVPARVMVPGTQPLVLKGNLLAWIPMQIKPPNVFGALRRSFRYNRGVYRSLLG